MKKLILFSFVLCSHFIINGQCVDAGNQWAKSWTSCQTSSNPNPVRGNSHWILYEFVDFHYIDSSHIWNSNRSNESGDGIKEIIVDYSLDGETWTELGSFTIPKATESDDYQGVVGPNFGSQFINKILVTVISTHAEGGCATIGEMLFAVDASKCHGEIDACGVCNGPGAGLWFVDNDGDGKGSNSQSVVSCEQPFGYVDNNNDICDSGELGWIEIFPIFENSCNGCHIEESAGGLNLGSYDNFILGGLNCGSNIATGNTLVSVITIDQYEGCAAPITFPAMNSRTSAPLGAVELDMLQRWINGGAPELCTGFCPENDDVDITFSEGIIAYRQTNNEIRSSALIESSTMVTFDAGQQVSLDTGFSILQGGQFIAKIDGCE